MLCYEEVGSDPTHTCRIALNPAHVSLVRPFRKSESETELVFSNGTSVVVKEAYGDIVANIEMALDELALA